MDSSSWIDGYTANSTGVGGNGGFMCGYTASRFPSASLCREDEEQQHELLLNAQIQQHLNQISMHMSADDVEPAAYGGAIHSVDFLPNSLHDAGASSFPSSSSASSSLRSASLSCSPEISSTAAHVLAAPSTAVQFPEVSSFLCDNLTDTPEAMAPGVMSTSASAFRRYERHLGPRRRLTKPACGQRMFKTAMSVLDKMHTAMKYKQQQQQEQYYYQQQQQQASAAEASGNQLQHMISERKRREKLNDSFHALRTVLPPGSRKDKTSMLIIAREYVTSLKSKVCELEEKNQALQALLAQRPTSSAGAEEDKAESAEKVEIQITTAAEGDQRGEVCTVKIAARPARGNTTDVVLRTLQCLKNRIGEDVSLLSMSTDQAGDGPHPASLKLHLKSASGAKWEEEAVREAVTKAVTTPAALSDGAGGP
ncbi:putative transcription factor bHLH041 [Lolium perenne]|uniref:putative transcription factor bHLH041 n=1 Tax=Lolium perenne TaxID=4522 RepID=UPI0021F5B6C3|nr:putative transcription factor bHLH041 [Lolium perenne]